MQLLSPAKLIVPSAARVALGLFAALGTFVARILVAKTEDAREAQESMGSTGSRPLDSYNTTSRVPALRQSSFGSSAPAFWRGCKDKDR